MSCNVPNFSTNNLLKHKLFIATMEIHTEGGITEPIINSSRSRKCAPKNVLKILTNSEKGKGEFLQKRAVVNCRRLQVVN